MSANTPLPTCLIVLGMAGSGKTSLVARLSVLEQCKKPYVVNLDPACLHLPYFANIDIRDTIDYKSVMKQYKLGPNGAIVTSLNLFATKFQDVLTYLHKTTNQWCVFDTPGQIEVFTWSVSGSIITESLATSFPTVIIYVMDTVRSTSPVTFMSNMLYACSILYKTRLPFIVVMNKIDVVRHEYALDWMKDFECFQQALDGATTGDHPDYITNLTRSMSLTLDEFYKELNVCGVSAATGEGLAELEELVACATQNYDFAKTKRDDDESLQPSGSGIEQDVHHLVAEVPTGSDVADIYLRRPGNDSSEDDSEGEERDPINDDEGGASEKTIPNDDDVFRRVLEQQRALQLKRAQEQNRK